MARFYLPKAAWGARVVLDGDEGRHATQVLRVRVGDRVVIFDGEGREGDGRVDEVERGRVVVLLGEVRSGVVVRPRVVLVQALMKGKALDWLIQKAVELGVTELVLVQTRHAVVQIEARDEAKKLEGWRRAVLEACKQCGQNWVPEVSLRKFEEMVLESEGVRMVASLAPGAKPMREVLEAAGEVEKIHYLVGPEGDWSEEELATALERGWQPVTLGHLVLRAETAAMFGLAAIRYAFEGR